MVQLIKRGACTDGNHHLCVGHIGTPNKDVGGSTCTCSCHNQRDESDPDQKELPPDLNLVDPGREIIQLFGGHCDPEQIKITDEEATIPNDILKLCCHDTLTIPNKVTLECVKYFLQKYYERVSWNVDLEIDSDKTTITGILSPYNTETLLVIKVTVEELADIYTKIVIITRPKIK